MNFRDTMQKKCKFLLKLLLVQTLFVLLFCSFHTHKDDPKRKVKIIVIDPGHGGKDPGCNGAIHKEKDVALAVALKLEKYITENIKDVKVILTRRTDVFVELEDRAKIANDNNADLFLSIHCNAAGKPVMVKDKKTGKMRPKTFKNSKGKTIVVETANPEPFGSETYVMGLKNEEGKMKVAQRENSAILLEDNYETKYQGFDPNSEESYIIMSNYTSGYVIQSAGLALKIQEQYFKKAGRVDKGVHRQSIWVLWRTSMPSVLTEIGYLTNPEEEKFLGSEKGQSYLAACLFRAFRKYKDEQEGIKRTYDDEFENQKPLENENFKAGQQQTNEQQENEPEVKTFDAPEEKGDVQVKKDTLKAVKPKKNDEPDPAKVKAEADAQAKKDKARNDSIEAAKIKEAKAIAEQKAKEEDRIKKNKADSLARVQAVQNKADEQEKKYKQLIALADVNFKNKNYNDALAMYQKAAATEVKDKSHATQKIDEIGAILKKKEEAAVTPSVAPAHTVAVVENSNAIVFKVQFASTDKEVEAKTKYANVSDVTFYKAGVVYKYTSGSYSSIAEAVKQQAKLRELGYKDCFVVAFKNGVRMDINEAKKLTEGK
jgi:N-acetylmuramoyl-L-alanine amidase